MYKLSKATSLSVKHYTRTVTHIEQEITKSNANRETESNSLYNKTKDRLNRIEHFIKKLTEHKEKNDKMRIETVNSSKDVEIGEKVKVEVINRNDTVKRDYKLISTVKYEHFLDYFTSELRARGLLHIIDEKIPFTGDEQRIEDQRFKTRDILINHLDSCYHSKVVHLDNPKEMLKQLKKIKRGEASASTHAIKKQLSGMQYHSSKQSAIDFCEKFDETIRNYESSPNAIALSEEEKRDAFYNAVMSVQTMEFMSKKANVKNLSYTDLQLLVVEEESTRGEFGGGKSEKAHFVKGDKSYCYQCGANGHVAKDCPNEGATLCYRCQTFGDHIATNCPNPEVIISPGGPREHGHSSDDGSRRGFKRSSSRGQMSTPKRGRYEEFRGRGRSSYRHYNGRGDYHGNKSNSAQWNTSNYEYYDGDNSNHHEGKIDWICNSFDHY